MNIAIIAILIILVAVVIAGFIFKGVKKNEKD